MPHRLGWSKGYGSIGWRSMGLRLGVGVGGPKKLYTPIRVVKNRSNNFPNFGPPEHREDHLGSKNVPLEPYSGTPTLSISITISECSFTPLYTPLRKIAEILSYNPFRVGILCTCLSPTNLCDFGESWYPILEEPKRAAQYSEPGNANRRWWGILKYPPQRKNFENTPPLKFWEIFFWKTGKNSEI